MLTVPSRQRGVSLVELMISMVLGLMLATAGLSAWVSNTATAAMMVPIAIAVLGVVRSTQKSEVIGKDERNFGIAVWWWAAVALVATWPTEENPCASAT